LVSRRGDENSSKILTLKMTTKIFEETFKNILKARPVTGREGP
jgi:hypothetical protein